MVVINELAIDIDLGALIDGVNHSAMLSGGGDLAR
jgi:hypothetical protein